MTTDNGRPKTIGRSSVVRRMQVAQLFGTFVVFLMGIIGSARGLALDS
jgi:hypothetical protein